MNRFRTWPWRVAAGTAFLATLAVLSQYNYLLFHSLSELFTIAVGWSVFLLAWSSRRFKASNFLLFLGMAYFFIGFVDLFHALSYKGMGVFSEHQGANTATQLWIAARFLEASAILIFSLLLGRAPGRIVPGVVAAGLGLVALSLLAAILIWPVFPDCFIEGQGLTPFKKGAEYVICLTLGLAMVLLGRKRNHFDAGVFVLIMAALGTTIAAELVLANYIDVYGRHNMIGHLLKLASYYLIYAALVRALVTRPYDTIFHELTQEKEALGKSEALYRLIVENTTEDVWQLDLNGRVTYVSPAVERIFGYTVEEAMDLDFASFFSENELPKARAAFLNALAGQEHQLLTFTGRKKDGTSVPIEVSVTPIRRKHNIVGVQGVARDITDRRVAEELSRINYQKYRLVYDHSPIAIALYDSGGRLMDVNPACLQLFGVVDPNEIKGFELFQDPNITNGFRKKLQAGQPVHYQSRFDFKKIKKRGLYQTDRTGSIWLDVIITPLGGETPIGYLVQAQDITERIMAEEALRESETQFRGYVENAPYGVFIANRTGRYVNVNPAASRITGYTRDELLNMSIPDLLAPESREKGMSHFARLIQYGYSRGETRFVHKNKEVRPWNVSAVRLREDRFLGFVEDITDRKQAEDRLLVSEERYRLLAESVSDVIWTMDLDLNFTYVSPSVQSQRGYTPEEVMTQSLKDVLTPASYQTASTILAGEWDKVVKGDFEPINIELEFPCKDGTTVWGESVISVIYGADRTPRLILGITRDITRRKQVDENREELLRFLADEMNLQRAIVQEARNVLEIRDFPVVARRIFDAARELTGAQSGYVALLSDSGEENEVLFLESGGLDCAVDPLLPMPVRGLRAEACKTGEVAVDNDFAGSRWTSFMPAGHVRLKNVLFAPLTIAGKTVGLIGLANKPDDFTEKDRVVAQSFGQLAAMALNNSRNLSLLEENEALLRETGRIARTGGWELDAETREVKWTEETYRIHELPLDYKPPLEEAVNFFHPDDRQPLSTAIENALRHGTPYDLELRFITAKNRHLWTRTICRPVVEDGKTVRLRGTVQDITERKQLLDRLKESERRYHQMFAEHSAVKILVDPETGAIVEANAAAGEFYGYSVETLETMNIRQINILPPDQIAEYLLAACHRKRNQFNFPHRLASGEVRQVEVHSTPIQIAGRPMLSSIIHDVTARKQAEENMNKALKEKETLLAEVHHRVKNNLQIISSLINLQINELDNAETIAHLTETRSRIQAMAFIHEGLYASPAVSELDMELHVSKIARGVSQSYAAVSGGAGVVVTADNIYLNLTQAVPVGLVANELLTNAYKHAFADQKKNGKIHIDLQQQTDNLIRMIISDNGVGMPDSLDWKNASSFGLRLAVSLVENQLDGTIALSHKPGTTFTIIFKKDN